MVNTCSPLPSFLDTKYKNLVFSGLMRLKRLPTRCGNGSGGNPRFLYVLNGDLYLRSLYVSDRFLVAPWHIQPLGKMPGACVF